MKPGLRIEDEFPGRETSKRFEPVLKGRGVDLELVSVRIEEVERIALTVILLPLSHSAPEKKFTKAREVVRRNSQSNMIVGGAWYSLCEGSFQIQADP